MFIPDKYHVKVECQILFLALLIYWNIGMVLELVSLVNWSNGIVMIAVFAIVCVVLIGTLVIFMNSGKKK